MKKIIKTIPAFQRTPEFYPQGTLVALNSLVDKKQSVHEVAKVIANGADSYLIAFLEPCPHIENMLHSVHLSQVEKIIKRGDGPLVIDYNLSERAQFHLKEMNDFQKRYAGIFIARKNHYNGPDLGRIFAHIVSKYAKPSLLVDVNAMARAYADNNKCTLFPISKTWPADWETFSVPKKKANRFVKQNLNRFLLNGGKIQLDYDQYMYEADMRSWDDDFDSRPEPVFPSQEDDDVEADPFTSTFSVVSDPLGDPTKNPTYFSDKPYGSEDHEEFTEIVNEFGFRQMVQWEGNGKYQPVCCQCKVTMPTNQGRGMLCESCAAEFMAECKRDWEERSH